MPRADRYVRRPNRQPATKVVPPKEGPYVVFSIERICILDWNFKPKYKAQVSGFSGGGIVPPKRIQRKREKGWRKPDNAKYVGRPTRWGNPFNIGSALPVDGNFVEAVIKNKPLLQIETNEQAVEFYRQWLDLMIKKRPDFLDPLREMDFLMCWCPLEKVCHVDVILERLRDDEKNKETKL